MMALSGLYAVFMRSCIGLTHLGLHLPIVRWHLLVMLMLKGFEVSDLDASGIFRRIFSDWELGRAFLLKGLGIQQNQLVITTQTVGDQNWTPDLGSGISFDVKG